MDDRFHYDDEYDNFDEFTPDEKDVFSSSSNESKDDSFSLDIKDEDFFKTEKNLDKSLKPQKSDDVYSSLSKTDNLSKTLNQIPQDRIPSGSPLNNASVTPIRSERSTTNSTAKMPQPPLNNVRTPGQAQVPPQKIKNSKNGKRPKGKKKHVGRKVAISILCVILALILAVVGVGYNSISKLDYDSVKREKNQYIKSSELKKSADVKNILLIGSDERKNGEDGVTGMRSDTMMLLSIDNAHKKLKLTSFLRDSYVYIPKQGYNRKLNAACSVGGVNLVCDTLEYNFKVKIDNFILVDFEAFTKFINLLGGLDIDGVTQKEVNYLKKNVDGINIKKGSNHLTGGAALWYARIRYLDDDFHRTERQRKVISALIKQVSKNPAKAIKAVDEVLPMISTDIKKNDLIALGVNAITKYIRWDVASQQIPAEGTWWSARVRYEGSVLKMDIDKNSKILKDFIYKDKQPTTKK